MRLCINLMTLGMFSLIKFSLFTMQILNMTNSVAKPVPFGDRWESVMLDIGRP